VKTQIIHLEPHDDVTSVLDKLKWVRAEKLVLVWPGRNRILTEKLDLRLIQRQAARRGAQVGIVSLDPDVLANAATLQIPSFENINTLHQQDWPEVDTGSPPKLVRKDPADLHELHRKPETIAARKTRPPIRVALFALPLIATLLLAFLLLPSAEVQISPITTQGNREFTLPVRTQSENRGAKLLYEDRARVEGDIRIITSGTSSEPGEPATGLAEFRNLSDEAVTIPAGTTIREPGSEQLYFSTQRRVILPGGLDATRTVEIVASQPGSIGNVPAGRITAIDGPLGLLVSVQNLEPTSGGYDRTRSSVTLSDLERARDQLSGNLLEQAEEILIANRLASEQVLVESLSLEQVLFEKFDRDVGDVSETLEIEMGAISHLYYVNLEELKTEVARLLSSETRTGEQIVPDSLSISDVRFEEVNDPDAVNLQFNAEFELYRPLDKATIARGIKAMRPLVAQRSLVDNYSLNYFVIEVDPAWYPYLPFLEMQIKVNYPWEKVQ
jgi:hypothetical protein